MRKERRTDDAEETKEGQLRKMKKSKETQRRKYGEDKTAIRK